MQCPICDQGNVREVKIKKTGSILFVCDECEATWFSQVDIGEKDFTDFSTYMRGIGLQPLWTELIY